MTAATPTITLPDYLLAAGAPTAHIEYGCRHIGWTLTDPGELHRNRFTWAHIGVREGVEWRGESAFGLDPASVGPVDWLFSDVICYPARLLRLVERWRASGLVRNFVCTIKFQGETDHETPRAFAAIPGASVLHLHQNKHELTFLLPHRPADPLSR